MIATPPPTAFPIAPWTNPKLALYHGTLDRHTDSILSGGVRPIHGNPGTDFGQGFYTSTLERQAYSWSWQLATRQGGTPAVIRFDVERDELASLDCLWFIRGGYDASDFWSFVVHCRSGAAGHARAENGGWYDVVAGPVTASWRQRLAFHDVDQMSFHTDSASQLLSTSNPTRIL